jgi:hypothetical protein
MEALTETDALDWRSLLSCRGPVTPVTPRPKIAIT